MDLRPDKKEGKKFFFNDNFKDGIFSNMDEYDYKIIIEFKYSHIKRKNNLSDFARKLIKII